MMLILKLAIVALIISVIVWGVFGYVAAGYLMAHPQLFRNAVKKLFWSRGTVAGPFVVAQNIAAAAAFTAPQPTIIREVGDISGAHLSNEISGSDATITIVYEIKR